MCALRALIYVQSFAPRVVVRLCRLSSNPSTHIFVITDNGAAGALDCFVKPQFRIDWESTLG